MNQGKRTKVVMLAHNNIITKITKYLGSNKLSNNLDKLERHTNQHLYFLSDEEIKEGDCVWKIFDNKIYCGKPVGKEILLINELKEDYKKIISSTDKTLGLPRPSDDFIQKYIEEYNKGNVIEEVLVEYLTVIAGTGDYLYNNGPLPVKVDILKVAPDNTITIKPIVETWEDIFNQFPNEPLLPITIKMILQRKYNPPTKIK